MNYYDRFQTAIASNHITGRHLACARYTAQQRAEIARDLAVGHLQLSLPTVVQAAAICRVNINRVHRLKTDSPSMHHELFAMTPLHGLLAAWMDASEAERRDFVCHVGPDRLFDVICTTL